MNETGFLHIRTCLQAWANEYQGKLAERQAARLLAAVGSLAGPVVVRQVAEDSKTEANKTQSL